MQGRLRHGCRNLRYPTGHYGTKTLIIKHKGTLAIGLCSTSLLLTACGSIDRSNAGPDFDGRLYVGGGVLVSDLDPDTDDVATVSVGETQSAGGSVAIGYDISNRFSIEGTYASLGEAELTVAGAPNEDITYDTYSLSALIYGLNDRDDRSRREGFSVFGRLGAGGLDNESDVEFEQVNDIHVLAGLGVEYGFRNGLGLRGELVAHDRDARYAQLGLVYRFGDVDGERVAAEAEKEMPPAESPRAAPAPAPAPRAALDSDNDGAMGSIDQCMGTTSGTPVDTTGCDVFGGVIEGVNFETSSANLTPGARRVLDNLASVLSNYPDISITIDAHTDNSGNAQANLELSRQRAISVARYLVGRGVTATRLKPRAFGESQPLISNATSQARAQNRRVEFSVVK